MLVCFHLCYLGSTYYISRGLNYQGSTHYISSMLNYQGSTHYISRELNYQGSTHYITSMLNDQGSTHYISKGLNYIGPTHYISRGVPPIYISRGYSCFQFIYWYIVHHLLPSMFISQYHTTCHCYLTGSLRDSWL